MPPTPDRRTRRTRAPKVPPFRKPGEQLGYAVELRRRRQWPPSKIKPRDDRHRATATPFLVVPVDGNDLGARPVPGTQALHSQSIQLIDGSGTAVSAPIPGSSYTLRASIRNLGATAAYAGLADFYVAQPPDLDQAAGTAGSTLPAQGRTGFVVMPGETRHVDSPRPWVPATADEARQSVLVHAYDLVLDRLTKPFDARADRHVGRLDVIADFAGVWDGTFTTDFRPGESFLMRVVIAQNGLVVNCSFFEEVGSPPALPSNPQSTGSSTIAGNQVTLATTDFFPNGQPFTTNSFTLPLTDPDTLQLTNVHVFPPGDGRPTQLWLADLHRV